MFRSQLSASLAVILVAFVAVPVGRAETVSVDLPELVGTFVHGQEPVVAEVDFGFDFQPLWSMTLEITATGYPGHDGAVALPVDLLVSAESVDRGDAFGMTWLPATTLGPYGQASGTHDAQQHYFWVAIYPPPITSGLGYLTIDTPAGAINDDFPSYLEITSARITAEYSPGLGGCFNCGFIGIEDLNRVLGAWNQTSPPADPEADYNGDGFIGIADLNYVLGNWNAGTPPVAVPEPTMISILTVSAFVLSRRVF